MYFLVFEIQVKNSRKLGENIFRYYNLFLSATVWRVTLSITAPPKFRFNHWMQVRWMCIHKYYFPAINSHKNLNLSLSLLCLDTPKLLILWEILIVRYGHEICILSTTRNKYFWFYDKKFLHNNTRNVCKQSFGYLVSWCHDDPNLSRHPRHFPSQLLVIYSWPNSNSILLFPAHTTQYQTQVRLTQAQSYQMDTWGRSLT